MEGGDIFLISLDGREEHVQISNDSLVTPVIAVLNVMPYGKRKKHSVVIFPDGIDPERFRELRVLLKWGGFEAPG